MFNDRSGFRNSCSTTWNPWNQLEFTAHRTKCTTSVVMDSHLFDYNEFSCDERNNYMKSWINECREVSGKAYILWHPQTLTTDYGWDPTFRKLIKELE